MWLVTAGDFLLLNIIMLVASNLYWRVNIWPDRALEIYFLVNNIALMLAMAHFYTIIHMRLVSAGDIFRRIVGLSAVQALLAYAMMRHVMFWVSAGEKLLQIGTAFFVLMVVMRLVERNTIKRIRRMGLNSRTVTLVGDDLELKNIRKELINNPTTGYKISEVWSNERGEQNDTWCGTVSDLCSLIKSGKAPALGDEMYVCLSRKERDTIRLLSTECDKQVTKFFLVPISVESIGLRLKREYINDIEVFVTHEITLESLPNRLLKRAMDVAMASGALLFTGLIFPVVYVMIKLQSPGPIFFKQERTGLNGRNFSIMKFRSMHVNKDADKLQATKNDPRKFRFGDIMRKMNIDELPQFWNVLRGDMSVVGPRPHMLAHTEMYSKLIDEYMVRHFVKPGITGWAQVTGFRGETKELWQMEGRVKRDVWYMENWTIWLDIRIIWLTVKSIFIHDKNAY